MVQKRKEGREVSGQSPARKAEDKEHQPGKGKNPTACKSGIQKPIFLNKRVRRDRIVDKKQEIANMRKN